MQLLMLYIFLTLFRSVILLCGRRGFSFFSFFDVAGLGSCPFPRLSKACYGFCQPDLSTEILRVHMVCVV